MSLKIFPCLDKKPLINDWPNKAAEYERWEKTGYRDHEEWGCPTGSANGFWVLDVDQKSGGLETLATLPSLDTLCFPTRSGGKHFYFQMPAIQPITNRAGFLPGIDVRGEGGYVILYGEMQPEAIKPAPEWLLESLSRPQRKVAADVHGEVGEGGRNHYLASAAGRMQKIGVLTLAALNELNESMCSPPLDEAEVQLIFHSVSRYAPESTPADDPTPSDDITPVSVQSLIKPMIAYLSNKELVKGEPTGLQELDELLGGGKRLGEVTVTCAEAKTGKNTFWHWTMLSWLDRSLPIGYASRELDPSEEVLPNLLSVATLQNFYKPEEYSEEDVIRRVEKWRLHFTPGYGPLTKQELFSWMDQCRELGVAHFFIDHLHYCMIDPEDFTKVSVFIRELKAYAKRHKVHIDLIVQPKNSGDGGFQGEFNSMRGGASLGQALDTFITMVRERDGEGSLTNVVKVSVKAARSKLAKTGNFYLSYDRETMTFEVVEPMMAAVEPVGPITPIARPESFKPIDGAAAAAGMIKRLNLSRSGSARQ